MEPSPDTMPSGDSGKPKVNLRLALNDWFPTLARYMGLALILYSMLYDRLQHPEALTAGVGLALIKTLWNGKNGK